MQAAQQQFNTLDLRLDPDLACQSPVLQEALDHWRILRGSREMPAADKLDALTIPRKVLPHITLLDVEYEPKKCFRWRLIGTGVTTILQRDMTGNYWDEIYSEDIYDLFATPANWVLENRAPMRFTAKAHVATKEIYDAEHIYMPLGESGERIERLFGVSIFTYTSSSEY